MSKNSLQIALLLVVCIAVRWLPNLIAPVKTFGYDFGFYLYNLNNAHWDGLASLIRSGWDGYGNFLFPLVNLLSIPSEVFLTVSQILLTAFTAAAFYYFWNKNNQQAAVWSAVLYIASIAQTQLYLMFLWKNLFALLFFVLCLKFIKDKRWWPAALAGLLVIATHRTTAIVLLISLGSYGVYFLIKKRQYTSLLLSGIAVGIAAYPLWSKIHAWLVNFLENSNANVINGIFLTPPEYMFYSLPLIIFGIAGFVLYKNQASHPLLNIVAVVTVLWIAFQLPFHNRIWIYFDVVMLIYGGYFIANFPINLKRRAIVIALLLLMLIQTALFTLNQAPLTTSEEIEEIKNFKASTPEALVIALDAADAPWLLGYLTNARVAAPGLFENRHSYEEWQSFWNGEEQKIFFTRYPRPLVLYQRSHQPDPEILECAPQISENFLQYECK